MAVCRHECVCVCVCACVCVCLCMSACLAQHVHIVLSVPVCLLCFNMMRFLFITALFLFINTLRVICCLDYHYRFEYFLMFLSNVFDLFDRYLVNNVSRVLYFYVLLQTPCLWPSKCMEPENIDYGKCVVIIACSYTVCVITQPARVFLVTQMLDIGQK